MMAPAMMRFLGGGGNYDSDVSGTMTVMTWIATANGRKVSYAIQLVFGGMTVFSLQLQILKDLMKVVGTDTINQNRDFTGEKNCDDLLG